MVIRTERQLWKATMEMERISYSLRELLVAQGIEAGRAGNTGRRGIGDGERSPAKGAPGHQTAEGGDRPIKGPVVRPAKFEPRVIEGGFKDVRRQNPTSVAPLGLRTSLKLVSSR